LADTEKNNNKEYKNQELEDPSVLGYDAVLTGSCCMQPLKLEATSSSKSQQLVTHPR
jgi:hypothetical protein